MSPHPENSSAEWLPVERREAGGEDQVPGANTSAPVPAELAEFQDLRKELGVLLVSAGVVGFVLPGPGTPAIIAGGLVLWPKGFGKAEAWMRCRFPEVHRGGMNYLRRFLNDLERRYPGTLHRSGASPGRSPGGPAPAGPA